MGGGGGQRSTTTPQQNIPPELLPLVNNSVRQTIAAQDANPLLAFIGAHPQEIPGLDPGQSLLLGQYGNILGPARPGPVPGGSVLAPSIGAPDQGPGFGSFLGSPDAPPEITQAPGARWSPLVPTGVNPFSQQQLQASGALETLLGLGSSRNPYQQQAAQGYTSLLTQPLNAPEQAALAQAAELSSGSLGSSPATQAGMEAWRRLVEPSIRQAHALQGNLSGGGFFEDEALSASQAAVPLIQQEIATRSALVPQLAGIGAQQFGQTSTALGNLSNLGTTEVGQALATAGQLGGLGSSLVGQQLASNQQQFGQGLSANQQLLGLYGQAFDAFGQRQANAAQQAQAQYQDYLRRQGLSEGATLGPLGNILPSGLMPGQVTKSRSSGGGLLGSVICTELYRQGRMDAETYAADTLFGQAQPLDVILGYQVWAPTVVRWMRHSGLVTNLVGVIALPWAREMAARMGVRPRGSWVGSIVMAAGIPVCRWLGRRVVLA